MNRDSYLSIYLSIYLSNIYIYKQKRISNSYFMSVLRVSCLTQSFSQLNQIYKRWRKNYNMVVSINLTSSSSFVSNLASAYFNWCRHFDTILFLLFKRFCCLYAAICNFSFKHSRQRFVCVLYGSHFLTISHLTFGWWPEFFVRQILIDNSVSFSYSFRLNGFLGFEKHFLKVVSHEPK